MSYSQNREDLFVLHYFGMFKGNLLSIGENNGTDFSNAKLLIENGWSATLFEPGITCIDLFKLHQGNKKVKIYNFGIGERDEIVPFYESGSHVKNGLDRGLVSTIDFQETLRWPGVEFTERNIQLVPFSILEGEKFDFISIDAEGADWQILQQINLDEVGCKCLCIEYNSNPELLKLFSDYCKGFKLALSNAENLVFCR